MSEKLIKQIEDSFKDHIAELTEFNGVQVVRFHKPDTNCYSMNVIYQGRFIYISGDLGEAVFDTTWKTTYKNCSNANFGYLMGKLSCITYGKKSYDQQTCVDNIKEWKEEHIEQQKDWGEYTEEYSKKLDYFVEDAICNSEQEYLWINFLQNYIEDVGEDYESELWTAGDKLNDRLYYYWIALRKIHEYLGGYEERKL